MTRYPQRAALLKHGVRSGLEEALTDQLRDAGVPFKYEKLTIPFIQPVKPRKYKPDFLLKNYIIVESKGRFENSDRQKHLMVKAQHPALEIRFVFSNSRQRISKKSRTTYADWCRKNGFLFSDKLIPVGWLTEPIWQGSKDAVLKLMEAS